MKRTFLLLPFASIVIGLALAADPPAPFPEPYDSEKSPLKPQSPAEAAKGFKMPPGFTVEVFAAEPDVRNPIAMCWDTKGRLWVAENYTYAENPKKWDLNLRDRVLIFHDKNGDGKNIERKVFCDNVQRLTSIEVGLGGVWLMAPPQLLFIPMKDDKPAGPPEVILEGFDVPNENYHNVANGLKWGPDGWLYGRCGASAPGRVRRPDQGPEAAIPNTGGIWRYHPQRKVFEMLCHGTTNPWGHDWDAFGECFFVNTVNGHLWHMIPGAHFRRPHTIDPNPLVYEPMEMIADHWHFETEKGWVDSRKVNATVDALGGGHAHSGCMIYNGDQWPAEYRGKLFTLNYHGRRMNVERLERQGSGYVGKREPDIFQASDLFFRGIDLSQGPDGSVYVLDWNDTGECHEQSGVLRSTGRIYRIKYGNPPIIKPSDLSVESDSNLAKYQNNSNQWLVNQSRRELLNRAASGTPLNNAIEILIEQCQYQNKNKVSRLNSFMTLFGLDKHMQTAARFTVDSDEHIQSAWISAYADRFLIDTVSGLSRSDSQKIPPDFIEYLSAIAKSTTQPQNSGMVRLNLASTLQRLPVNSRISLASALLSRKEDANDANLPFIIWYGLIPVALKEPEKLVDLAANAKIPLVRKWTARRFAEIIAEKPNCLNELLAKTADKDESVRMDVLKGMEAGLAGIRKAKAPDAWKAFAKTFEKTKLMAAVRPIDVIFGDGRAIYEMEMIAKDDKADLEQRKAALRSIIEAKPGNLREICEKLIRVRFLNSIAVKGLVQFDVSGPTILNSYGSFHPSERSVFMEAMCSRPSFAALLLDEMAKGRIARSELSAAQARTIRSFEKPELTAKLASVWGEVRVSPQDKLDLIAKIKADHPPEVLAKADKSQGRAVFAKTCAVCHTLFGSGAKIGPDLTGAGRKDLDYIARKIADPSAIVTKDFQVTKFQMTDGRTISGIITATAPSTVTVQTEKEKITIAKSDIESQKLSTQSLMPDGLLQTLKPDEIRNLIAYLQSDSQVELPK